jgi:hypothetical protein
LSAFSVGSTDVLVGLLNSAVRRARRFVIVSAAGVSVVGAEAILRGRPTGRGREGTLAGVSRAADLRAAAIGLAFAAAFGGRPRVAVGAAEVARGLRALTDGAETRALRAVEALLEALERDETLRLTDDAFDEEARAAGVGFVDRAVFDAARAVRAAVGLIALARWVVARVVVGRVVVLADVLRARAGAELDRAGAVRETLAGAARFVDDAVDFARTAETRATGFVRAVVLVGEVFVAAFAGLDVERAALEAAVRLAAVVVVFALGFAVPVVLRAGVVDARAPAVVAALRRPPARTAIVCARTGVSLVASLLICSTFCLSRPI